MKAIDKSSVMYATYKASSDVVAGAAAMACTESSWVYARDKLYSNFEPEFPLDSQYELAFVIE